MPNANRLGSFNHIPMLLVPRLIVIGVGRHKQQFLNSSKRFLQRDAVLVVGVAELDA